MTGDAMRQAAIRVDGLCKRFGETIAVDSVSFEARAGEFLALLGPSGSGKSTILMTVAGFEPPTTGDIYLGEERITDVPANRRNIGMVFQRYALFPHMDVRGNVSFPLRMRRLPRSAIGPLVDRALQTVRLEQLGSRMPHQLSGGQQQRVALARAIVHSPPALLMDEPLGALDQKLRREMQREIKHLQRRLGVTVIFVTHDQHEALTMADRVAVLNQGRLEQIGAPSELYDKPATRFVADFIGESNFLPGRAGAIGRDDAEVALPGGITVRARTTGVAPPSPNAAVEVAIRPERVQVAQALDALDCDVRLMGQVQEVMYEGPTLCCFLRLEGDIQVSARLSSPRFPLVEGQRVALGWLSRDATVYPAVRQ